MKRKNIFCFSLFLFLLRYVSSKDKYEDEQKNYNNQHVLLNIIKDKLEKLQGGIITNKVSDTLNKDFKSLKKRMEELEKYEKKYTEGNIENILKNESEESLGDKKQILGVDEDEYNWDFLGQGNTMTKGEDNEEGADDNEDEEGEEDGTALELKSKGEQDTSMLAQGAEKISTELQGCAQPTSESSNEVQEQSGGTDVRTTRDPAVAEAKTPLENSPSAQSNTPSTGENEAKAASQDQAKERQPVESALVNAEHGPTQGSNISTPKVQYLDKLFDDYLIASDKKKEINVHKYHRKYNDFKKAYEFTMNDNEYKIVKELFDFYFKKGEEESSNASNLINLFKKVLDDNVFRKEFDNIMHGIYGFAKRYTYLRGDRTNDENVYKELFKNMLSLSNIV
ncbi:merozoite surface protein 7 (MSP7), putative [Plasmodium malariae]|uniref:Merozoite surface protein 7 (MSP7), putative n=1 Tax=Plasmodium malariae TaxID=5858 RepID=A0A1A8WEZ3_PLAMA|nr:merozoite surface protein 7 (MSP7), putative [Plasmodium malariae]